MNDMENMIVSGASASPEEQIKTLEQLDDMGIFMLPGESWEHFIQRVKKLLQALREIEKGIIPPPLQKNALSWEKLPENFVAEANQLLMAAYKFSNIWAPAYFSRKETGSFAAGVQLEVDETFPLIFLHDAFANKASFSGYPA